MLIRDIMRTEFETAPRTASLREAVEKMLKRQSDYVILTNDGEPDGLITERKALVAAYKTKQPLGEIPVSGFATGFPTTVRPTATVLLATGHLIDAELEVLPVAKGLDLVGVVTREDLLDNSANLRDEAFQMAEQRDEWEKE